MLSPPHPAADVSPYLLHKIISSVCSTSFYPLLLEQDFGWVPQKEMMIMEWWDMDLGLLQYQGCLCPSAASVPGLLQSWLYIPHMWVTQKWLSITIHDSSDLFVVEYVKKDEQVLVFSLIYALYNTLTIFFFKFPGCLWFISPIFLVAARSSWMKLLFLVISVKTNHLKYSFYSTFNWHYWTHSKALNIL